MSAQSAAESLITEFVSSPEFQAGLHEYCQSGSVRSDNLLGILRQYVSSPSCEVAHRNFWASPSKQGPESEFVDNDDTNQSN
jgi:hypothetical protein